MEELKLNVRALAAQSRMSIEALAEKAGIEPGHLKSVSSGRVKMTAEDLLKLSEATGISPFKIEIG